MKRTTFLLSFIFLSLFFGLPADRAIAAENGCTWKRNFGATTLCSSNEGPPTAQKRCNPDDMPTQTPSMNPECCCPLDSPAAFIPPKFILPDLQVDIPGLTLSPTDKVVVVAEDGTYSVQIPWIAEYIKALYDYGLSIAGILAALVLMGGGLLWLISGGDATKMTQAKEMIIGSVTGLVILASSYIILVQINPALTRFGSINIKGVQRAEFKIAETKNSAAASSFKDAGCASNEELAAGVSFYATGYYKPAWEDSDNFRCIIAMQCSCPNGIDESKKGACDHLYGKTYPGYAPCKAFPEGTEYCHQTASGSPPADGTIAGPPCSNLPFGTKVCFKGTTYTITDRGGGIKGKRIDIWTGTDLNKALDMTGIGNLKLGACS